MNGRAEDQRPGAFPRPAVKKSEEELQSELLMRSNRTYEGALTASEELVDRSRAARAAMEELCNTFMKEWVAFSETCDERLKQLRMTRMAVETETRLLSSAFRDIRASLGEDFVPTFERIKELISLLADLKQMREDGTLERLKGFFQKQ